jgi:EAL domain-containing protein (putative c-di-GMP-specific phosphodiesterase class I)
MTGAEALVRWLDPALGLIRPGQFVADRRRVRPDRADRPLGPARSLPAGPVLAGCGSAAVPVAVNISAVEFRQKGFVEGVALILEGDRSGAEPISNWN